MNDINYQKMYEREKKAKLQAEEIAEKATRDLYLSNLILQEKNSELEAFNYILAHDFKAPARNIQNLCAMLKEEMSDITEDQKLYIDGLIKTSKRLSRLVDAFQKLTAVIKKEKLELKNCTLEEIASSCLEDIGHIVKEKKITFSAAEASIRADETLIRQLFFNLLNNALLYAQGNDVRIDFTFEEVEGQKIYGVKNTGSSIPQEKLEEIFKPLKRLHADDEGMGLGLSICKKVVINHDGHIWVESSDNEVHFKFYINQD